MGVPAKIVIEPPLVSVVTPSLNQGRFIGRTIASVRAQDHPRIEHLVIDGGSSDETLRILDRAQHVRAVVEPDRGQSDAVNKGLRLARGAIVGWLNADDLYTPGAVRTVVQFFDRNPDVDLVYGDCAVIDETDRIVDVARGRPFDYRQLLLQRCRIPQPTAFWRRAVGDITGGLDPQLHLAMDFDFWLRAGLRGRIAHVPDVLAAYRVYPAAKSSAQAARVLADVIVGLERAFADPALPAEFRQLRARALATARRDAGVRLFNAGDLQGARVYLARELRGGRDFWHAGALRAALMLAECVTGIPVASRLQAVRRYVSRRGAPSL